MIIFGIASHFKQGSLKHPCFKCLLPQIVACSVIRAGFNLWLLAYFYEISLKLLTSYT